MCYKYAIRINNSQMVKKAIMGGKINIHLMFVYILWWRVLGGIGGTGGVRWNWRNRLLKGTPFCFHELSKRIR